jgi:hypothetical protein
MPKYLVGFDRFIDLEWANYAFELAARRDIPSEKISVLKDYLSRNILGKDAVRKTANLLTRLWLEPDDMLDQFRNEALSLAIDTKRSDYVFFHWGITLMVFPLFQETCLQIGRLAALQTAFTRQAIKSRISEKYSNKETVARSVDNIFQTLINWGLLLKQTRQDYIIFSYTTTDLQVKRWLLEAVIYSLPTKRILLNDFYRLPVLFPFEFNGEVQNLVNRSARVGIERDGNNLEYICWRHLVP